MPYVMIFFFFFLTDMKEYMRFGSWNGTAQMNALAFGSLFAGGQKFLEM